MIPKQLHDFKNFMYLVWKHLNLPDPTPVQYDIADYIQSGVKRVDEKEIILLTLLFDLECSAPSIESITITSEPDLTFLPFFS